MEREYESQLSHTIWELERTVRRGASSESLRRTLVETHVQHIRHMEEIAEIPRHQRTQLHLQPRPAEALLLLPGEGMSADELEPLAEGFHRRGFGVLTTNLAFRALGRQGYSPQYWQTCADEAETRYDVLAHYATEISILGVGLAGLIALHVATVRPVARVAALLPTLDAETGWVERLKGVVAKLLRRDTVVSRKWPEQRKAAARAARTTLDRIPVPLYILAEDRSDKTEEGRTSRVVRKLVERNATRVRLLRPGEAASIRSLSPAVFDEILNFLRRG